MTTNYDSDYIFDDNSATPEKVADAAKSFFENKKYEQALKLYKDMLLYNASSEIYEKMGTCYYKLGQAPTALEYWEKAIELDPLNSYAYICVGNMYHEKQQREKAISYWLAALIPMPEEPTTNLNLAVVYTEKGMYMEAYKYYEKYLKYAQDKKNNKYLEINASVEKNTHLAKDYLKLGITYQSQKDNLSAVKCYVNAIKACPTSSKGYLNLGAIYYSDKNYEKALEYWQIAYYLDPAYPKIISNLAVTFDMLEKFDYAYCYYSRYANYIYNDKIEYDKVVSRGLRLKPFLNKNPYLIENHLEFAKEAFSNCDYYRALTEFKNYTILKPEAQELYGTLINKIENFLSPEAVVINACQQNAGELYLKEKYKEAIPYYARILVLADKNSVEFYNAKTKLTSCMHHLKV